MPSLAEEELLGQVTSLELLMASQNLVSITALRICDLGVLCYAAACSLSHSASVPQEDM